MRKCAAGIAALVIVPGVCYARRRANAALPPGSTKREAQGRLRANGFREIASSPASGLSYFETRDGILLEGATEVVYGDAPSTNVNLLREGELTVFFFFGRDGGLVKMHVQAWICGL